MELWNRMVARRRRKAHERYLLERARQQALEEQDTQEAIRDAARQSGATQQGMYGQQ
jgi:phage gp36-like protein